MPDRGVSHGSTFIQCDRSQLPESGAATRASNLIPMAMILVAIFIANGPALVHLVTTNPLVIDAGLSQNTSGWLPGLPYIDPNVDIPHRP